MKKFNGKAIYNPSGKAGEYSEWACNFHTGCSNGCKYCYLKKGILKGAMGGNTPKLKACFKDEVHALKIFEKELKANLPELQKHGLFFSFTTDPMLPGTAELTAEAINICVSNDVFVKILTKRTDFVEDLIGFAGTRSEWDFVRNFLAIGFTLTGHDELEPNASTNAERIEAMRILHKAGFKNFASIEPIIDCDSSVKMMWDTKEFCNLYKVGLMSGKKYHKEELLDLIEDFIAKSVLYNFKVYFKDSLLKQAGIERQDLPSNCVGRDYNIFNN